LKLSTSSSRDVENSLLFLDANAINQDWGPASLLEYEKTPAPRCVINCLIGKGLQTASACERMMEWDKLLDFIRQLLNWRRIPNQRNDLYVVRYGLYERERRESRYALRKTRNCSLAWVRSRLPMEIGENEDLTLAKTR
jgi:hypothetical protein